MFKNLYLTTALCGAIFLIINTELSHFRKKKTNRLNFEKEDLMFKDEILNHFLISSTAQNQDFFKKVFDNLKIATTTKNNYLISNNCLVAPLFNSFEITNNDIIGAIKEANSLNIKNVIIFCAGASTPEINLNTKINLVCLNGYETFAFLKKINTFPISKTTQIKKHQHIIFNKTNKLTKNHFKPFFMGSVFLFITSFLVPQKLYYITLASVLLGISLICLVLFKKQKIEPKYEQVLSSFVNITNQQKTQN